MKRSTLCLWVLSLVALSNPNLGRSQSLPTTQPKLLSIIREEVKVGRSAEHAKHEAGWPAAYEKAKSPDYYLAMTSMTGPSEAWYLMAWESHAALGNSMKRDDKDPVLSAEVERLTARDAEFINSTREIQAFGRPDLSVGVFPELTKARFFEVTIFRVRPGHEAQFEEAAKAYAAATKRSAPTASYRTYQVLAGMPAPTYFVFSSVEDFAEFDKTVEAGEATWKGATPEEQAQIQKCSAEGLISSETNRFKVDPGQSYVSKATREKDPEFWMPK